MAQTNHIFKKECGHDHCILTLARCCACLDQRSMNGAWVGIYVDGKGMVPGTRASTYCTACRDTQPVFIQPTTSVRSPAPKRRRIQATMGTHKDCGHHFCQLTISTCCACTDKRPKDTRDTVYVDGKGLVSVQGRSAVGYCPSCRDRPNHPYDRSFVATFHDIPVPNRKPTRKRTATPVEEEEVCTDLCFNRRRRQHDCCNCSITKMIAAWMKLPRYSRTDLPEMPRFCALCLQSEQYGVAVDAWNYLLASTAQTMRRGNRRRIDFPPAPKVIPRSTGPFITAVIPGDEQTLLPLPTLRAEGDYRPFSAGPLDSDDEEVDCPVDSLLWPDVPTLEDESPDRSRAPSPAESECVDVDQLDDSMWSEFAHSSHGSVIVLGDADDEDEDDVLSVFAMTDDVDSECAVDACSDFW